MLAFDNIRAPFQFGYQQCQYFSDQMCPFLLVISGNIMDQVHIYLVLLHIISPLRAFLTLEISEFPQYKLGKRLGGGAFSDVYCAEDRSYRRVALKRVRLLDNRTISFYSIREASLLYALKHENIVRYFISRYITRDCDIELLIFT